MKALVVSVVIAMTTVFNAFSNGNLTQFAYNTTTDGEKVESQTVYTTVKNGKYLQQHLKYNYTYDDKGNVSQKEVLKWNEITKVFEKQYCLNITYNAQETSVEYTAWDNKTGAYSDSRAKAVYQTTNAGQGFNYLSYEWNKKENNWNLAKEHTILYGDNALMADK